MNFVDVIFFQAEIAPDRLALVAHGSIIPYGRLAQGILSAQQRLSAIGLTERQTVGVHVVHPIDNLVLICALHRMRVTYANITNALDAYLENVQFDAVLADNILPTVSSKQPSAKFVLVDPSWFRDQVTFTVAQRTGSRRNTGPDWVSRVTCYPKSAAVASVVKTTSLSLEAQLLSYCLSAPPVWDRMISIAGLHTDTGFLQALAALGLGRSVVFADVQNVRSIATIYKHEYLVASSDDIGPLLRLQEVQFSPMHNLRAACIEGRVCSASTIASAQATIASNVLFRYVHPEVGIVAYGDASRFRNSEGAAGFIAPWVDAEVVDSKGSPLAAEAEGALRFRRRKDDFIVSGKKPSDEPDNWIYPQQRAKIMRNKLLVIRESSRI